MTPHNALSPWRKTLRAEARGVPTGRRQPFHAAKRDEDTMSPILLNVTYFAVGDEGRHEMPWSEVCCHMLLAGRVMRFRVVGSTRCEMVQLLNEDGSLHSFPITPGEAGLYRDAEGRLYSNDI